MFRLAILFAGVAAATAQPAVSAKPAIVLTPSSNWHLNYAEQSCRLARTFGEGENLSVAFFTQHGPSRTFELTLAGPPLERFMPRRAVKTQFGPIGEVWDIEPFKGDVDSVGPALIYSSIDLEEKSEQPEEIGPMVFTSLPVIAIDRAKGMDYIEIEQRSQRIRFATGALEMAIAALSACSEDLLSTWGLDVERHRSLTRTVEWTNSQDITKRIMRDYPLAARRKGEQGIVRALLLVDEQGAVDQCKLADAANSAVLLAPACRALSDAVFKPALDREGQPMRSFYIAKIVYKMG